MNTSLISYISDNTRSGLIRDTNIIESQMILTTQYPYCGYDDKCNDEQIEEVFKKVIGLKGRLPDLQSLADEAWEYNSDLIHEMAVSYALDDYYQSGVDIENEVDENELEENINSWHSSCVQMYSESNMLDEAYEIHRYATRNGISYIVNKESEIYEWTVSAFDIDTNKDILMNHAQGVMFDEFVNDEESVFNYGKFAIHYMARGNLSD